jgi:hypothetical protein
MFIVKRGKAQGGFNIMRRGGGVHRMMNLKSEGLGKAETHDFFEKTDVAHPFKSFSKMNLKALEGGRIKTSKKKYISLNI